MDAIACGSWPMSWRRRPTRRTKDHGEEDVCSVSARGYTSSYLSY
ncbi:hypothetical protein ACP4OV_020279 [Aristida adscensionis]